MVPVNCLLRYTFYFLLCANICDLFNLWILTRVKLEIDVLLLMQLSVIITICYTLMS